MNTDYVEQKLLEICKSYNLEIRSNVKLKQDDITRSCIVAASKNNIIQLESQFCPPDGWAGENDVSIQIIFYKTNDPKEMKNIVLALANNSPCDKVETVQIALSNVSETLGKLLRMTNFRIVKE